MRQKSDSTDLLSLYWTGHGPFARPRPWPPQAGIAGARLRWTTTLLLRTKLMACQDARDRNISASCIVIRVLVVLLL